MSQIELDHLLSGVAQLTTTDLEQFAKQVNVLLAQRKVPHLPEPEANLLQQINQGLPEDTQHRYNELSAKLRAEIITHEEHQEFLNLIDIADQANANRLQHLIELSQLRQVSLPDLMHQLGICPPTVHA